MKKGLLAGGILILLLALSLWHVHALGGLTAAVWDTLAQAEAAAEAGDWDEAAQLTRRAEGRWRERDFYLHITLQHKVMDEVELSFAEVHEFLQNREAGEYSAANARLMQRLALLGEAERPSLENLL